MSSLIRRIERQVVESQRVHPRKARDPLTGAIIIVPNKGDRHPAREVFFGGRGSRLGTNNPKCKARVAREARDRKWGRSR